MGALIALTLVCAVALVGLRLLAPRDGAAAGMRVVGRLALEPRRSIYLVDVGGRYFVVGVGDGPMAMLAEVDRPPLTPIEDAVEPALVRAWRRVVGGRA